MSYCLEDALLALQSIFLGRSGFTFGDPMGGAFEGLN